MYSSATYQRVTMANAIFPGQKILSERNLLQVQLLFWSLSGITNITVQPGIIIKSLNLF